MFTHLDSSKLFYTFKSINLVNIYIFIDMKIDLENAEVIGEGNFAKIYKFFSKEHKNYLCARSVIINPDEIVELEKEK